MSLNPTTLMMNCDLETLETLDTDTLSHILKIAGETVAMRATCRAFARAIDKRTTYVREVAHTPPLLQWATINAHLPINASTCAAAAAVGSLATLQWLRANCCLWDMRTCSNAVRHGHLNILQWARENGCPCYANICSMAAEGGYLEILQWAHTNGFE